MICKRQLIKVLVISTLILAGCTPVKPTGTPAITPPGIVLTGTNLATPHSQMATPAETHSPPQAILTGQAPQGIAGWQQYVSANMKITIAYPSDWSATENNGEVAFTSPAGGTIRLDQIQASNLSPQGFLDQDQLPNTRCSSGENSQGVQYRSCLDTIALSMTAYLVINPPQGSTQFFTLSTFERGDLDIFNAMLASFHAS
jgi:hypothetical protein